MRTKQIQSKYSIDVKLKEKQQNYVLQVQNMLYNNVFLLILKHTFINENPNLIHNEKKKNRHTHDTSKSTSTYVNSHNFLQINQTERSDESTITTFTTSRNIFK